MIRILLLMFGLFWFGPIVFSPLLAAEIGGKLVANKDGHCKIVVRNQTSNDLVLVGLLRGLSLATVKRDRAVVHQSLPLEADIQHADQHWEFLHGKKPSALISNYTTVYLVIKNDINLRTGDVITFSLPAYRVRYEGKHMRLMAGIDVNVELSVEVVR